MVRIGCLLLALLAPAQDDAVRGAVDRLRSDRPAEREDAERALRAIGPAALPALRAAAGEADTDFSRRAVRIGRIIEAVELLGPRVLEKIPGAEDLIGSRNDRDWTALFLRAHAMPGITTAAMEALVPRALAGAGVEDDQRPGVARIIAERGLRSAVPGLIALLSSPDAASRECAALALGHLRVAAAFPAIRRLLHDQDSSCRAAAATALGAFGSAETIPELALAVTDSSATVSFRARNALQQISPGAAVDELTRLLDRNPLQLRGQVAVALESLRNPCRERYGLVLSDEDMADVERPVIEALTDVHRPDAAARILPLLRDKRVAVRRGALNLLLRLQARPAAADFLALLRDADTGIRLRAVEAAGDLEIPGAVGVLRELLRDPSPHIQGRAAYSLCKLKCAEALPELLALLTHGWTETRKYVVWGLWELARAEDAPAILPSLEDPDDDVRNSVIRLLWKVAPVPSLPSIVRTLGDKANRYWTPEPPPGPQRAELLAALRKLLGDPELPVRRGALLIASRGGFKEATPEITRLADDPDPDLRAEAVGALAGFLQRRSIGTLVAKIMDDHESVRSSACWKLAELGAGDQAVPELLRFLNDRGYERQIVEALESLCAREAVPALNGLLKKNASLIRLHALSALVKLQSPPSLETIRELLEDSEHSVRRSTIETISSLRIREAVPELRMIVRRRDPSNLPFVIDTLGTLGATEAAPDLLPLLEDDDSSLRTAAARALGRLGERRAIPLMKTLLDDHDSNVRQTVALALGELGATEAVPDLLRLLRREEANGWTAWGAVEALAELRARESVPDLVRLLQQEIRSQHSSYATIPALKKLDPAAAGRAVLQILEREDVVPRRFSSALSQFQKERYVRGGCHFDPPPRPRVTAIHLLAELGTVEAIPVLRRLMGDPDEEIRLAAACAFIPLAQSGMASEIADLLRHPHATVRALAVKRLGALGRPEGLAPALALLRDPVSDVRSAAVPVCARLGGAGELRPLLADADYEVRIQAASALCRAGDSAGAPLLLEQGAELTSLNALRDPATWKRLAETPLRKPLEGTVRELLCDVARQADLAPEIPEILTSPVASQFKERRRLEGPTLLDALNQLIPRHGTAGLVLGEGRLRVVLRGEEWKFWETWSEQARR